MQFDDFDKRIKEAASHHHPAYDEKAWNKMERLLNKHLPVEKKRRRRFLFIIIPLLLLMAGAGLVWVFNNQSPTNKTASLASVKPVSPVPQKSQSTVDDQSQNHNGGIPKTILPQEEVTKYKTPEIQVTTDVKPTINKEQRIEKSSAKPAIPVVKKYELPGLSDPPIKRPVPPVVVKEKEEIKTTGITPTEKANPKAEKWNAVPVEKKEQLQNRDTIKNVQPGKKQNSDVATNNAPEKNLNEKENKVTVADKKKHKKSLFFLSLSVSPDASFASGGKTGKMKLLGGGGLGYTFRERVTLRSGVYIGRKIYPATAADYNPPPIFWNYYPYLEKVDANCKVIEIPVAFSYNFGKTINRSWFVSGGLSSLIMKEEEYYYTYKYTPGGRTYYREWDIKNQNKHLFSVATISAGVQQQFGKSFSVIAEPYLKMPLTGVGYGKVRLNSMGVQVSVSYSPFGAKLRK
ncbi:MAG TPA: hypothetical protein VFV31_10980 [Chitinophagaceae bacterium]|nr:hypothetical protein [Chitinophagaceae bacterium]